MLNVHLCINRLFEILNIRRHGYFLFIGRSVASWPPVNCPVSRIFFFFNSLLTPHFDQFFSGNSSVNLFAVYPFKYKLFIKILSSLLNTMLIVDKHCSDVCCDEFSVPQTDRKSKQVKEQWHGQFICNQYGESLAIVNTKNIKICAWITKLEAIANVICLRFLPHLQKIWIFNFPR